MNIQSLRFRTFCTFLLMLVFLVGFLLFMADSILGRGFREVEQRSVSERVEQAMNALNNSIAGVSRSVRDYAIWDDSYAFMTEPSQQYADDNLVDVTFVINNLSYIGFVRPDGQLVSVTAFDQTEQQLVPPPPELSTATPTIARLLALGRAESFSGVIVLADGPLLIAGHPILTSQGDGPPAGMLLMGRRLNGYEIQRLSEITRLPLEIVRLDDPALAPGLRQAAAQIRAGQPIVTNILDEQRIRGDAIIPDLLGGPGLLLQIELPRDVYQLGQAATREYTLALLITGLLFGVAVFIILERTVLRRTINLNRQVALIEANHPDVHVSITGSDEVGQLGDSINQMLIRLAQAQQQIAASEQRYRQLIELSPDAVIIHDGQQVRYTNSAGARLLGDPTPAASVGRALDPVIMELATRPNGTPLMADRVLTTADGRTIEAELVTLPFRDLDVPATQVIIRNITERKQLEKALRIAKESADAANRAKSQFLSTMSHELRTPLTAIIGYAELAEQALASTEHETIRRDVQRIHSSGTHLLAIINDVLDLSKIEAGRMLVQPHKIAVEPSIRMIIDTIQPLAERNSNHLELYGIEAAGMMVTDEGRLRQILVNLLGNACKFTQHGVVSLKVIVQPDVRNVEQDTLLFVVSDTGIGMNQDQIASLFQDFVQVDASTTRKYGGTGLGLALSRRLAHLLGGNITVVSEPGAGSTFTLALPRVIHAAPPEPVEAPSAPLPASLSAPVEDEPETRIVLVIDDDPSVRDLLPRVLAHRGLHFETAATGAEGLDLAGLLLPDLIILDVLLPELDGWSVLRQLKDNPETRAIPVLMFTVDQDAQRALVLGAAGFLNKPVDAEQLMHELTAIFQGQHNPTHLLLVEDDPELCDYLQRTLEQGGWRVTAANDAPAALAVLDQHHPDLAVIDLMLPGMNGITLIGAIRARADSETLPIMVVTAKELTDEEQTQLNHSVEQVLRKGSFRGDEFVQIAWALARARRGDVTPQGATL